MKTPPEPASSGLAPAVLARLLSASGGAITEEQIRADLAAGAPANPDGSINLIRYGAWLVKQDRNGRT